MLNDPEKDSPPTPGKPRSLRFHFALLVCGVLFPVVAFSVVVLRQLAASEQQAAERRFLQSAHDLAASIDRELAGTIRALELLSRSESLDRGDLATFYTEAQRAVAPAWSRIILADQAGKVLLNTSVPRGQPLPAIVESDSLALAISTRKPVVGSLVPGPGNDFAFPIRVPITDKDGAPRYVLTAVIQARAIADFVDIPEYSNEWTRAIVDTRGTIVARTREPANFVGRPTSPSMQAQLNASHGHTFRDTTLDGRRGFAAFSRAPVSGWAAVVVVPVEAIDGPAFRFLLTATLVGAALLVASAIGAFILTRRLTRGILDAVSAAESLSLGRRPAAAHSPVAEISRLLDAMRQSADLLDQRDRERREHLQRAQEALAAAEEANRAKDDFLAMLGHELRNPLGPLRNSVHLLSRALPPDGESQSIREMIERQVTHMTRLVDELLDASRVSRGTILLQLAVLDLAALLRDVVSDYRPQFEAAGLTLSLQAPDHPVRIEGDRTRLAQCVGNLLHNALKFTPTGGAVSVALYAADAHADVEVSDTGPGIPADLLPRIFEPFSQGPQSLARMQGGLGLGLALVKGLTHLHGGTVSVRSRGIGLGATFSMRLPLTLKAPAEPGADAPAPPPENSPQRVLIVEDLPDAARSLKMLLTLEGHAVDLAGTAADALRHAPEFRPTVIICDIGLPDMDGYELCRRLRTLPAGQSARLVALTGYGQASDVSRAYEAGFDLHLTKPVDIASLQEAVRHTDVPLASAPSPEFTH